MMPADEMPDWWWDSYDGDESDEIDWNVPCCICSCLIGDEVNFGEEDYWGDGRPICSGCLDGS